MAVVEELSMHGSEAESETYTNIVSPRTKTKKQPGRRVNSQVAPEGKANEANSRRKEKDKR